MQFSSLSKVSWIATDWSIVLTFKLAGRQLWHHALQTKTHSVETRAAQLFLSEVEAQRNERERRSSAESHIIPFRPRSFSSFSTFLRCWPSPTQSATHWFRIALYTQCDVTLFGLQRPEAASSRTVMYCNTSHSSEVASKLFEEVLMTPGQSSGSGRLRIFFSSKNIVLHLHLTLSKWTTVLLSLILFDFYWSWRVKI